MLNKMNTHPKNTKTILAANNSTQVHSSPIPLGVRAGDFIFLSALRGVKPGTPYVETSDPSDQAKQLFTNFEDTLKSLNLSFENVVKVAVYMKNLQRDRSVFNKFWKASFGERPPARHAVEVSDLGDEKGLTLFLLDITIYDPA